MYACMAYTYGFSDTRLSYFMNVLLSLSLSLSSSHILLEPFIGFPKKQHEAKIVDDDDKMISKNKIK